MPSPPPLTPQLVSAAYRRALRFGAFWRLRPEERAILLLARRLQAIKSPLLREAILGILEKVWPEKAATFRAYELGVKALFYRVSLALKIGAQEVARELLSKAWSLVPVLGFSYMNIPAFYKPNLGGEKG